MRLKEFAAELRRVQRELNIENAVENQHIILSPNGHEGYPFGWWIRKSEGKVVSDEHQTDQHDYSVREIKVATVECQGHRWRRAIIIFNYQKL